MLGVRIFIHSLKQVFGNLGGALRVIAPIVSAQFAAFYALGHARETAGFGVGPNGVTPWLVVVSTLLVAIPAVWMAVAWHRLILLGERPRSIFPPFHAGLLASYLIYSVLLAIVLLLLGRVLAHYAGSLLFSGGFPSYWTALLGTSALIYVPLGFLMLKLSPLLPAAAVGRHLGVVEAWSKTRKSNLALLTVVILAVLCRTLIILGLLRLALLSEYYIYVQLLLGWLTSIVVLSILTTIYGHFVEGRELRA